MTHLGETEVQDGNGMGGYHGNGDVIPVTKSVEGGIRDGLCGIRCQLSGVIWYAVVKRLNIGPFWNPINRSVIEY